MISILLVIGGLIVLGISSFLYNKPESRSEERFLGMEIKGWYWVAIVCLANAGFSLINTGIR